MKSELGDLLHELKHFNLQLGDCNACHCMNLRGIRMPQATLNRINGINGHRPSQATHHGLFQQTPLHSPGACGAPPDAAHMTIAQGG